MKKKWRNHIEKYLQQDDLVNDITHGRVHALEVEKTAMEIVKQCEIKLSEADEMILRAACLLHDIGYTNYNNNWSKGKYEHIFESIILTKGILSKIEPFSNDDALIESVCYLILKHDDTNYSFPICSMDSCEITNPINFESNVNIELIDSKRDVLDQLVKFIREADALQGIGLEGAKRTFNYSISRGLPIVSPGNAINSYAWEESAITNVRLAERRGILDAYSKYGRSIALKGYAEVEGFIKNICRRNSIKFEEDGIDSHININEIGGDHKSQRVELTGYKNWYQVINQLRNVTLRCSDQLFPYAGAEITSELIGFEDISPLAYYVLEEQIKRQEELYVNLLKTYGIDIFNLSGIIEFKINSCPFIIAPPIIEYYYESEGENKGPTYALVDGLHRCFTAQKIGLKKIRVIMIKNVGEQFPLVPLPLTWDDVSAEKIVPSSKRIYRFKSREDIFELFKQFPTTYNEVNTPIKSDKDQDVIYYTYRDLSMIGSDGIRAAKKINENDEWKL
jgi:hypothetical protein